MLRTGLVVVGVVAALLSTALLLQAPAERVVVVDRAHPEASDANAGTRSAPLATIGRALQRADRNNRDGMATRVLVRAGLYREALRLPPSDARTDAPLTIEGEDAGRVIVSGSQVWPGWRSSGGGRYAAPWPHRWGLAAFPSAPWERYFRENDVGEVVRRREVVFVDGTPMRQVLAEAELAPGTFLVDEARGRIVLAPPRGVDPRKAYVEVSVRDRLLDADGWSNLTIRGLTFQHAASPMNEAAVRLHKGRDVAVEDVRAQWNNWTALALQDVEGATVRRSALSHNGVMGLSVYRSTDTTVSEVDNSDNNTWRGAWGHYTGWSTGAKVFRARRIVFTRWHAVGNVANGLWLDTDVADAVVRDSFMGHNTRRGLFLEAIQGPVTVADTVVCGNADNGIVDGKADDVTLSGNRVFGNAGAQILFSGARGGRSFATFDTDETLTARSRHWALLDNVVEGVGAQQVVGNDLDAADWSIVRADLTSERNRWHHRHRADPFTLPAGSVSYRTWADAVGETAGSLTASSAGLLCTAAPPPVPAAPPVGAGQELLADGPGT